MNIISNVEISPPIIHIDGDIVSIFLIIVLSISFLLSNTKHWNFYVSRTMEIVYDPMVWIFIGIVIFKIIRTITAKS